MLTCKLTAGEGSGRFMTPDGRDPASLSKFVKLLGRTKVKDKCPNLNASHDLLTQVCEGHVLAALIQRTGVEGFEDLRGIISSGAWREAVESIANDWVQLDFVDRMREDAACEAARATTTTDEGPISGETVKQSQSRIKKATEKGEAERRDVVFENISKKRWLCDGFRRTFASRPSSQPQKIIDYFPTALAVGVGWKVTCETMEGLEANPPDRYARHQVRTRHQTKASTQYPPHEIICNCKIVKTRARYVGRPLPRAPNTCYERSPKPAIEKQNKHPLSKRAIQITPCHRVSGGNANAGV
jgi:hypothetical protein